MKRPFAYLTAILLALSLEAAGQAPSGSASVSSTITVRIPAFVSLTLADNTSTTVSKDDPIFTVNVKEKSKPNHLQTNHDWMLNVDRIFGEVNKLGYANPDSKKHPVVQVIYTATPK